MTLHLYNTLTKRKEEFKPLQAGKVRMYSCGPTVYSQPHIGNFRAFIAADILRRYLEYKGYQVEQVMNITDVGHMTTDDDLGGAGEGEDKIQLAARREKKTPETIARFYEQEFMDLARLLNLEPAKVYPRATEHIKEMIGLIQKLLDKGYAYVVSAGGSARGGSAFGGGSTSASGGNGNVYYEVNRFKNYGRLSGNTLENLMAGARVEVNPEKRNPFDFALWKQDPHHIMQWDSPWGRGFPGWHIECSVMSMKYLGDSFDIHTGGEDNIFPHHESEIAQAEAATGKKFVKYWFHIRHLLVNNQKMSKSLGNFYTVRDILKQGYHPLVLRYALLNTHYQQSLNFTREGLEAARNSIQRLRDFKHRIKVGANPRVRPSTNGQTHRSAPTLQETQEKFESAMDDDLNISEALGVVFDFVREINKLDLSPAEARQALDLVNKFDRVLGVLAEEKGELSQEIEGLVKEREAARQRKDYQRADEIRQQLKDKGIILEDTSEGVRWKRSL